MSQRAFVQRVRAFLNAIRRKSPWRSFVHWLRGHHHVSALRDQLMQLQTVHNRQLEQLSQHVTRLQQSVAALRDQMQGKHEQLNATAHHLNLLQGRFAQATRCLAEGQIELRTRTERAGLRDGPLVSVVMPVWNRERTVAAAVHSILAQMYRHWELLIVDDGSTDRTWDVLESLPTDDRITLYRQPHSGVSAARNHALEKVRGEVIAYLDSDNRWLPYYLTEVVSILEGQSERDCVYMADLTDNSPSEDCFIRCAPFDPDQLQTQNWIDLNVFAHRRTLYERLGGFDETLTCLVDWDLIWRYAQEKDPVYRPVIGARYNENGSNRITAQEGLWLNYYRVRRKNDQQIGIPLRVLYAVHHYPQLTESYVRWETVCMKRWGVEVEVWSEFPKVAAPFEPEIRVHTDSLAEAIQSFQPHIIHVHWLHLAKSYREVAARFGLPVTVRGHGYEYTPGLVAELQKDSVVRSIYLFPHLAKEATSQDKIYSVKSAFDGDWYYPAEKDRRLVVRVGAGLPTKDLKTFLHVAQDCPEHRFVLVLGRAVGQEALPDEMIAYNRRLGNPVEIRINLQVEEISSLVRRAGIYLHTFGFQAPFGMPMSIGEALATGAYVLARRCAGSEVYLGDVGDFYETAEDAVQFIRATLAWPDARWRHVQQAAVEHAYQHHADVLVLRPLLEDWLAIARSRVMFQDDMLPLDLRFDFFLDYSIEQGWHRVVHHDSCFTGHQVGVGRGLVTWGCDLDVCLAGMAHSVYGTEQGGVGFDLGRRDELRQIIGERAEQLAYWNCAMDRQSFDLAVAKGQAPYRFRDRFTNQYLVLSERDFLDVCSIHLCDGLEQAPRSGNWNERRDNYFRIAERLGGLAVQTCRRVYALADGIASTDVGGPQQKGCEQYDDGNGYLRKDGRTPFGRPALGAGPHTVLTKEADHSDV